LDGLVRHGLTWVAVQNGRSPPRAIRYPVDLQRQQVLESGTPGLGEPTHGIVVDGSLWFISDVGWDRFEASGARKAGVPPARSELRVIPLDGHRL
jgi:hypothetical protein